MFTTGKTDSLFVQMLDCEVKGSDRIIYLCTSLPVV